MARMGERRDDRCSKPPAGRFISFTSLTAPIDQVLMQTKDEGAITFPDKLKGDPTSGPETNTTVSTVTTVMTQLIATT